MTGCTGILRPEYIILCELHELELIANRNVFLVANATMCNCWCYIEISMLCIRTGISTGIPGPEYRILFELQN